jgi:hypothetical protein
MRKTIDLESNKNNKTRGMKRKPEKKNRQRQRLLLLSRGIRLVRTGYSVKNVSCGLILIITCALTVMITQIKCCILPRILLQLAPTAKQFATVTLRFFGNVITLILS